MRRFSALALILTLTLALAAPAALAAPNEAPQPDLSLWSWLVDRIDALFTTDDGEGAGIADSADEPTGDPVGPLAPPTEEAASTPEDSAIRGGADPWG